MDVSIFLAKALGIYFLIMGMAMVLNREKLRPILMDFIANPSLLFLSGVMALIIGILMVLSHNIWVMDWRIFVTIMAWLSLLKGATRVIFPNMFTPMIRRWVENDRFYAGMVFFLFVMGGLFLYWGTIEG